MPGDVSAGRVDGAVRRIGELREAEVEHLDCAVGPQLDVGRFEVAVDDAVLVRRFERLGDLPRDREGLVHRQSPAGDSLGEGRPLDELHRQERVSGRLSSSP